MQDLSPKMSVQEVNKLSMLALAHVGDGVYELLFRSKLCFEGYSHVSNLHKLTVSHVNAVAQAKAAEKIMPVLDADELAVYKRGRNAKSVSPAKNQSITDYRRATGFEALLGYLYLKKDWQRLLDLVKIGLDSLESHKKEGM